MMVSFRGKKTRVRWRAIKESFKRSPLAMLIKLIPFFRFSSPLPFSLGISFTGHKRLGVRLEKERSHAIRPNLLSDIHTL
jgi:hypothetical protein